MNIWKKEQIDNYIVEFKKYYIDCSVNYFTGMSVPSKLNQDELRYLKDNLNISEVVGSNKSTLINDLLKDHSKDNFSLYLINTRQLECEVNSYDKSQSTIFIELARRYFEDNKIFFIENIRSLFSRGYKIKPEDNRFVLDLHKKVKQVSDLDKWTYLRLAVILNDEKLFEKALSKNREIFTILSFKQGKPYHFNFPNLLGVLNNAIQHYRESGDIILHAMTFYNRYVEIRKLDTKGTFIKKWDEYLKNKPIQDAEFEEIVKIIFPEFK